MISPYSRELVGWTARAEEADIDRAVAAARRAFDEGPWPRMSVPERIEIVMRMRDALTARAQEIPTLVAQEMGSPVAWGAVNHAAASIGVMGAMCAVAGAFGHTEVRRGMLGDSMEIRRVPVGVVAAVTPWNVPMLLVTAKVTTALLAGCTVVVKPASITPLDALLLADAAEEVGLPEGVLSILPCNSTTGNHLVGHPDVDKVTFTGSVPVGSSIWQAAGANVTRVTLELGGKSAAIVMPDADLDTALADILRASMPNMGQVCISQTRILLPRSRYDEFATRYVAAVESLVLGDPLDPATQVGPMSTAGHAEDVRAYIRLGLDEGAELLTGGPTPPDGYHDGFVRPTVFGEVKNSMRVAREEIFGPVVCLLPYDDVDEAVAIANDSDLGLSGSVWGADVEAALAVARQVRTGHMNINRFTLDFLGPFGGFKHSGVGREFGPEGYSAFLETQTINLPAGYAPAS